MKTVVTGGAGFIGSNLIRTLVGQGRRVVATDNVSRGKSSNLDGMPIDMVQVDLRNYRDALNVVEGADCVYHLAAKVGSINYLHGGMKAELDALQSNLAIDTNVFRACVECGVDRIVYASSVSVYPIDRQQRLGATFAESDIHPINPEGGYGWAKLIGETQLDLMETCKSGIARIFNAYGEFSDLGATAQVVPALIRKAIKYPEEEFIVWGDGTQTRSLLYVQDCIRALFKLEDRASFPPLKLNIGNPHTVTIRELAEKIVAISRKKMEIVFDPSKPVGPLSRIPDVTRAKIELDWEPKTSLIDGLEHTYEWASNCIGPK
jgi:GDP-D-mannose 3',5'-epimerase